MEDRVAIKERAKEMLRDYRGNCIGVYVLYTVLVAISAAVLYGLGSLFLEPPLLIGISLFSLYVYRGEKPGFETLFSGFNRYVQSLVSMLWMDLWIFLWSLLFIIPGIYKALAYSMTPYLVADHPNLDPRRALKISMIITKGRIAEILVMYLSFFGWILLSALTLGILQIVHVGPYMQISLAGQYEMILADALETGVITEQDLQG